MKRTSILFKAFSVYVALSVVMQIAFPTVAMALTGGPIAPEFSSFEPVTTTQMVQDFTGDFTYNLPVIEIPGPDGSGYPLSLSYHAGTSPEQEASWVGYGWTLNPGAINRSTRGYPDDWKGREVINYNEAPTNSTVTVGGGVGTPEVFSKDIGLNLNKRWYYNNYKGFGSSNSVGINLMDGMVSLGFNYSSGEHSFSVRLNPAAKLMSHLRAANKKRTWDKMMDKNVSLDKGLKAMGAWFKKDKSHSKTDNELNATIDVLGGSYGIFTHNSGGMMTQSTKYTGQSYNFTASIKLTPTPIPAGLGVDLFGSYSWMTNDDEYSDLAYGYMYSANSGTANYSDYYTEKLTQYDKQDRFLGMPFTNYDQFMLTGEGLGGGFRMYNRKAGHFRPNSSSSQTVIANVGAEFEAGFNFGGGVDAGAGVHTMDLGEWSSPTSFASDDQKGVEPNFFRFNNDLGGYIMYGTKALQQAGFTQTNGTQGFKSYNPDVAHIDPNLHEDNEFIRASHIGYNTNAEMNEKIGGIYYRAYEKHSDVFTHVDRSESAIADQIGEISVVNEVGMRYNYGLPVFSRLESDISYDTRSNNGIDRNFIAYKNTDSYIVKVGQTRKSPYASTYLLTSIFTPDYIDRTNDGATEDDFGGYTRFEYVRIAGSNTKNTASDNFASDWYQFRSPSNGLKYAANSISDTKDNKGSVSDGEREVYYLNKIETKTHYALFVTSNRKDGREAELNRKSAAENGTGYGATQLKRLDRIELYAKKAGEDKLLKTVRFDYSYRLCSGIPNHSDYGNPSAEGGKLTLEKLWFEYEGIVNAEISPYEFSYEYPTVTYPSEYADLDNYVSASVDQNPEYSPFSIDAWGNYQEKSQPNGKYRYEEMKHWLDQTPDLNSFDPAAWQLKRIKLPSGGEIHVQYEQDDYMYVQDQRANAMVSLWSGDHDGSRFYLNNGDLGISTVAEMKEWANLIHQQYYGKRIYFKFLYKLMGTNSPELNHCNAEYIDGYAKVNGVAYDAGQGRVYIDLANGNHSLPFEVCKQFVRAERNGKLSTSTTCNPDDNLIGTGNAETVVKNFLAWVGNGVTGGALKCLKINKELSYFKVPVLHAKKGGGLRVKRLLMYDSGIESGRDVLYGTEYFYKTYDEKLGFISSGVATNEPIGIREENVLVKALPRFDKPGFQVALSGRDKKNSEGPLGESIMPGASVGYSRVITRGIHSGETNTGFSIKEFFTAKDFPVNKGLLPKEDMTDIARKKDYLPLPGGFINRYTNKQWLSQGFLFELNNMHGMTKATYQMSADFDSYFGPDPINSYTEEFKNAALVSSTVNEYFEPGEEVPVMTTFNSDPVLKPMGQEMELTFETRSTKDVKDDGNVEGDITAGVIFGIPVPFAAVVPSLTFSRTELYTHVTTKVVRYPVVLKSVTTVTNGVQQKQENIAFDGNNGQPLIVRTTDHYNGLKLAGSSTGHEGKMTSYSIPASHEYPSMGQKAVGEHMILESQPGIELNKTISSQGHPQISFDVTSPTASACELLNKFGGGDLVQITNSSDGSKELYHTGEIEGTNVRLLPVSYATTNMNSYSGVTVEILRSGRTNQLKTMAGGFVAYGDELNTTSVTQTVIDQRKTIATALNNLIVQSQANSNPNTIPKLEFASLVPQDYLIGSSCGQWTTSHPEGSDFIQIEDGKLYIYSPKNLIIDYNHPMVAAINNYFCYAEQYEFSDPQNIIQSLPPTGCSPSPPCTQGLATALGCSYPPGATVSTCENPGVREHRGWQKADPKQYNNPSWAPSPGTSTMPPEISFPADQELETFRNHQLAELDYLYEKVNNGEYRISDFFEDIDHNTTGKTMVFYDHFKQRWLNARAVLELKSNGRKTGFTLDCHDEVFAIFCDPISSAPAFWNPNNWTSTTLPDPNGTDPGPCPLPWCGTTGYSGMNGIVTRLPYLYGEISGITGFNTNDPSPPPTGYSYSELGYNYFEDEAYPYICNWSNNPYSVSPDGYLAMEQGSMPWVPEIRFYHLEPECETDLQIDLSNPGQFRINEMNGQLEYVPFGADCSPVSVPCLFFCNDAYPEFGIEKVLTTSASTYSDNWGFDDSHYYPPLDQSQNDFETGKRGKWRMETNYVYRADRTGYASSSASKTYNSGYFTLDMFNWQELGANIPSKWLLNDKITKYSAEGRPLEDENILGVNSMMKYGYDHNLIYMSASNCSNASAHFESFEKTYSYGGNSYGEDGTDLNSQLGVVQSEVSHSGNNSYEFFTQTSLSAVIFEKNLDNSYPWILAGDDGVSVRLWAKNAKLNDGEIDMTGFIEQTVSGQSPISTSAQFSRIGRSGDWELYEAIFVGAGTGYDAQETSNIKIYASMDPGDRFYFDDIRVQPIEAQANCFVYDAASYKLMAIFDDQHYGIYYQYDHEGKLVRKIRETERGLKLTKETQYNSQKTSRP